MSLDIWMQYPQEPTENQRAVALLREAGMNSAASVLDAQYDHGCVGSVFSANITHNLSKMAQAAGIYEVLWHPGENGITHANQMVQKLEEGLRDLESRPEFFSTFNASNGWGTYEHFVPFVREVLKACKKHPKALVEVSI